VPEVATNAVIAASASRFRESFDIVLVIWLIL
jgi:hypothetical protein